jgi:hypothetical protein
MAVSFRPDKGTSNPLSWMSEPTIYPIHRNYCTSMLHILSSLVRLGVVWPPTENYFEFLDSQDARCFLMAKHEVEKARRSVRRRGVAPLLLLSIRARRRKESIT